ncbi:CoA-transferase subunit beta [Rhodococcoides kyotonense]|uniref:Acyl CoA:acetate/3-ketoacid CoA transferase, beta subunit n=1 Tax=Rhodococcoides kyotonense TaxID=398843 RepID=A0A239JV05_9NOCA|nr:CoA-transferase [Rhodococcus kyotonensis]SNT09268.1 Acyl CoA:acetate/3-ketoacid CoA transferase, beta subunit [Rhodococcus kyotonensis]
MTAVTATATRAETCIAACADLFLGSGEILASPMAPIPSLGARLARLTTEPDLLLSDGEAYLLADTPALGDSGAIEGWIPYRAVFDVVASGRRHVVMGANQIDRYGNQNISCLGDHARPTRQMFGVRGGPGNTINHRTSYWVPRHSSRVFVDAVDMVSGVGYDKLRDDPAARFVDVHRVVSNLGVFDFDGPGRSMRLRSVHPGVTVDDVRAATSFDLPVAGHTETRVPTESELELIRDVLDPRGIREKEVPSS